MYNIQYLIWDEFTKFDAKVWTINEEMEFWRSIVFSIPVHTANGYSLITVMLTSLSRHIPAGQYTEHKKQLLYFLERHRISYHHGCGHRTALIWIRWTITCGAYWSSECIAHAFVTSVTSRHVWLKSGRSLTRRSLTRRLASGVYVTLRSCIQQEGGHFEHRLWNSRQNC